MTDIEERSEVLSLNYWNTPQAAKTSQKLGKEFSLLFTSTKFAQPM